MPEIYQAKFVNPAYIQDCKTVVGLPVLSSFYMNYANSNISYYKIFNESNDSSKHVLDIDKFINKKLNNRNFISFDTHISLFSLSIRRNDDIFSFDVTEKIGFTLGIPRKLLGFALYGNGHPDYMETSFDGLGIDLDYYREYAFGYSSQYDEYFTFGIKAKLLFGKLNIYTKKLDVGINTDPRTYALTLYSDSKIYSSAPGATIEDMSDPVAVLLNRKNIGLAFDFGTTYNFNEKVDVSASIIDLGAIRWSTNPRNIEQDTSFSFSGIDDLLNFGDANLEDIPDTLRSTFVIDSFGNNSYYSFLPLKVYLSGTYKLTNKITIGALNQYTFYNKKVFPTFTLSANIQLLQSLKTCFTYSIVNSSYNNLGVGYYFGRKGLQIYVVRDNVLSFPVNAALFYFNEKLTTHFIDFQNYNFRFGLNLLFGCSDKKKIPEAEQCPWMKPMNPDWLKKKLYYPKEYKYKRKKKKDLNHKIILD